MKIWVFTICWNEALMMPWFLRHYSTFADKIIVFDEQSTDGTRDIVKSCPKAELRDWDGHGLNDVEFQNAVNTRYLEARWNADWVMWPDVDEILYHSDMKRFMSVQQSDVVPSTGYAMIGDLGSEAGSQIYDIIKTGYPQDNYSKWIIWRPEIEIVHNVGRHDRPKTNARFGSRFEVKLLHYHYFTPEYTKQRNERNKDRAIDKKFAWNYEKPAVDQAHRGTHTWVQGLIDNSRIMQVVP